MDKYEALDLYTEACGKCAKLERQLELLGFQIFKTSKNFKRFTQLYRNDTAYRLFDIEVLVEQYRVLHSRFVACVDELNQFAFLCDKPIMEFN